MAVSSQLNVDVSMCGVYLTVGSFLFHFNKILSPLPISQQISGVTTHFRRIRTCRLAGKESMTLLGPITGTSQQERLSGNGLSPSQWISRALGKGHLAL